MGGDALPRSPMSLSVLATPMHRYNVRVDISTRVAQFIAEHQLLEPGERVVVGLSGGPDSLALYVLLRELGYVPIAAHLDHSLRAESADDARSVAQMIAAWGGEFHHHRADVGGAARREHRSLEEAARRMRYQFLTATALECGCRTVAVGHTADDQAETVLLHLLRGTGVFGLRGMLPIVDLHQVQREVPPGRVRLVRPLLCLTRDECARACLARGLAARSDPSNEDLAFLRNRIRHQLLPNLETYNPAIRRLLVQTAQLMAAHSRLLELAIERGLEKCITPIASCTLWIDRAGFAELPEAVRQGVAREALAQALGGREDIALRHVLGLVRFVANPPNSGHAHLMKTVHVYSAGPRLYVSRDHDPSWAVPPSPLRIEAVPGRVLAQAFSASIELDLTPPPPTAQRSTDAWSAWIDFDRVHLPLCLRAAAPADRIRPLGAPQEMRLSDFLARQHVPQFLRRIQPVLADEERVVWVPGLRIHHEVRLSDRSERALHLRWIARPE